MSVPPEEMETGPDLPRFDIPDAGETPQIDPDMITAGDPTQAEVQTLAPPQDIDAATIGDYTPYQEVTGELDPTSTVEGRLGGLLSQDSNYMRQARARGTQLANRRGMLNASLAAGASEGAAMDRALPIAQQDAAAMKEQEFLNQGYSNDAARYLAEQSVTRENLEAGFEQDTSQFNAAQRFEADRLNQAATNRANELYAHEANKNNFAQLSADLQAQLKGIDNDMAMRLETLTREYGLLENMDSINGSIYQQMVQEMGTILANADKVSEATGKINALIQAAGVEFSFSSGMTGGGGSSPPNASGGPSEIGSGDIRPPRPTSEGDWYWSDKDWEWKKRWAGGGGGGSCFTGDTMVLMADGSEKEIADCEVGDIVQGMDGEDNVVTGIEIPLVGERHVYSLNDTKPFVTAEHPFMTSQGWKSLDPVATIAEGHQIKPDLMLVGDYLEQIGAPLIELTKIEKHYFDPETPVYNLFLTGNHTYYAGGFLVHNKAGDNGGGGSSGGGTGGGDGSGCFSGDTCFLMADGSYKLIRDIKKGDVTLGGVVTNTRSGPSDRDWYNYRGSRVTDEHFVFEGGEWKYVKDADEAHPIEPYDTYYTVDTTDHVLHGENGALFTDDAVFDEDHFTHDMPYGKEQWDVMLDILNKMLFEEVG